MEEKLTINPAALDAERPVSMAVQTSKPDEESIDLRTVSPQALAFVGDAVYELMLRTSIVRSGSRPAKQLQKESSKLARAGAQAAIYEKLQPYLTDEECKIARRGRNAHPGTVAKHATVAEYRRATGLEALIGALYLQGREERIQQLLDLGWSDAEDQEVSKN